MEWSILGGRSGNLYADKALKEFGVYITDCNIIVVKLSLIIRLEILWSLVCVNCCSYKTAPLNVALLWKRFVNREIKDSGNRNEKHIRFCTVNMSFLCHFALLSPVWSRLLWLLKQTGIFAIFSDSYTGYSSRWRQVIIHSFKNVNSFGAETCNIWPIESFTQPTQPYMSESESFTQLIRLNSLIHSGMKHHYCVVKQKLWNGKFNSAVALYWFLQVSMTLQWFS